jgi:hypothetical protein
MLPRHLMANIIKRASFGERISVLLERITDRVENSEGKWVEQENIPPESSSSDELLWCEWVSALKFGKRSKSLQKKKSRSNGRSHDSRPDFIFLLNNAGFRCAQMVSVLQTLVNVLRKDHIDCRFLQGGTTAAHFIKLGQPLMEKSDPSIVEMWPLLNQIYVNKTCISFANIDMCDVEERLDRWLERHTAVNEFLECFEEEEEEEEEEEKEEEEDDDDDDDGDDDY